MEIKNHEELRTAVTQLNAYIPAMCNVKTTEEVAKLFGDSKDLLIAIFKYNVERTGK